MIPIELPEWVRLVAYVFLGLMVLEIAVRVWQILNSKKINKAIDMLQEDVNDIQAKVGIMFYTIKTYYEVPERDYDDDEDEYTTDEIGRVQ